MYGAESKNTSVDDCPTDWSSQDWPVPFIPGTQVSRSAWLWLNMLIWVLSKSIRFAWYASSLSTISRYLWAPANLKFDANGVTGGCLRSYTVVPAPNSTTESPPECANVTAPTQLDVDGMDHTGELSQYGWVDQVRVSSQIWMQTVLTSVKCTDISIKPKNGTPPFTLTVRNEKQMTWHKFISSWRSLLPYTPHGISLRLICHL